MSHQYTTHIESLENVFDTIQGLLHILEDDASRAHCEGPDPVFNDFHRGTLHGAIRHLTEQGYSVLSKIDAQECPSHETGNIHAFAPRKSGGGAA